MEDSRWLRLLTVGLVLAALAVGYFLFTGRFSANSATRKVTQVSQVTSATPAPSFSPLPTPASAYNRIVARTQTQTLPRTGFPLDLAAILSVSVMISGWGLRRFPK